MNYAQVDHALTFLAKPGDRITLQVPYHKDVYLVRDYIIKKMGRPKRSYRSMMEYPNGIICFESVCANYTAGLAQDCVFFIDRDHDRSYYEWLETDDLFDECKEIADKYGITSKDIEEAVREVRKEANTRAVL